ncbi:MAG: hypothetical protein HRT99_02695 [Mycoplasmatales bacterium]|nr:hypothetical protein [Mycoplasmatales bacterium]
MKVAKFPKVISNKKKTMILGAFSTFHNGHKILLDIAKSFKKPIIMIIMKSPSSLPNKRNKNFSSLETRLQQFANVGIDEVIVIDFDKKIQNTDGFEFAKMLKEKYNVERFVVGKNFNMGKNASFTSKDLKEKFPSTIISKIHKINEISLSTSLLSEMIQLGDVDLIKKYTPFYFSLNVRVKPDKTFSILDTISPHSGIYAAWAIVNDVKYWAICRISSSGKHELYVEDLLVKNRGFDVSIEFVNKIRIVIREDFDKIIEKDKKDAINFLKNDL